MATNFRNSAGTDFDDLFDPYVTGTVPPNTAFRTSNGVDLAGRYAPISFGSKGPDVGFRTSAGTDVSNLWAAYGTAHYGPAGVVATSDHGASPYAEIAWYFRTDAQILCEATGNSSATGGSYPLSAASGKEVRFYGTVHGLRDSGTTGKLTGTGVSFTAATPPGNSASFDTGWISTQSNTVAKLVASCQSSSGLGAAQIDGTVNVQSRDVGTGANLMTTTTTFQCIADGVA